MNKLNKWRRRIIEDKERRVAKKAFYPFVKEYGDEVNNFAYASFGTSLTIFRDGLFNDTDIDFYVNRKNVNKLVDFIIKNDLKILDGFVFDGKLSEIKIIYKGINVDFFIVDKYSLAKDEVIIYTLSGNKIVDVILYSSFPKKITLKKIEGINVITNRDYYEYTYGSTWETPMKYTYEFFPHISLMRRKTLDKSWNEKCIYLKNKKQCIDFITKIK